MEQPTGAAAERTWGLSPLLYRVLLLAPPLVIALYEIIHPAPTDTAEGVRDGATWFLTFHLIQLPLIGLVGLSVILLAESWGRAQAWTTRLGVGLWLVFFSAYDAIAGVATGVAMRNSIELPPAQQEGVWQAVKDWRGIDLPISPLGDIGTLGWVIAVGGLAWSARRLGAPRLQWVLLALAAIVLIAGHPRPFGTFAFGCLFVAAVLRLRDLRRPRLAAGAEPTPSPATGS